MRILSKIHLTEQRPPERMSPPELSEPDPSVVDSLHK